MNNPSRTLICGLLAAWAACGIPVAQAQQTPGAATVPMDESALTRAVLADPRARASLGPGEVKTVAVDAASDKSEAAAYLEGRRDALPARHATVLLWNRATDKAIRALVSTTDPRVLGIESLRMADVPLIPEELDEALALVKASPQAQKSVGPSLDRFILVQSGDEYPKVDIVQALPVRSSDPKDPCAAHRCLQFLFRSQQGYLPLRAQVDLSKHAVSVIRGRPHEGAHP